VRWLLSACAPRERVICPAFQLRVHRARPALLAHRPRPAQPANAPNAPAARLFVFEDPVFNVRPPFGSKLAASEGGAFGAPGEDTITHTR
jgi:hypothetical protein